MIAPRMPRRSGVTLTELLVVISIILILSAAALPTAYVTFAERAVSEGASMVQANISMTRDRAAGTGQAQGVRFLPDPDLTDLSTGVVVSNRMVTLTTPPNYSEGLVVPVVEVFTPAFTGLPFEIRRLSVYGAKTDNDGVPSSPTAWHFNIRQGETLRIGGGGNQFTIAGPITVGPQSGNPERFINRTVNGQFSGAQVQALPISTDPTYEILYLVNGRDDSGNGYVDPHFDGIDNNGDTVTDPGYNGLDDNGNSLVDEPAELLLGLPAFSPEYETDDPILRAFEWARVNGEQDGTGIPLLRPLANLGVLPVSILDPSVRRYRYVVSRRPSAATDSREYTLPGGAVIDFTTLGLLDPNIIPERSRVPIDPVTGIVDLMIYPNGQVVPSTPFGLRQSMTTGFPFYFLWIAAREDVHAPPAGATAANQPLLPMPREYNLPRPEFLEGYRRMVTISPNSGHSSVSEIAVFNPLNVNAPYEEAALHQQTGR
ncbi:pilus assembly FimT family protein [Tautonia rosea]|uniref:pilus assembly FimT family protein n=1 Tax=Tautonia rosea TaxID=2728037 RepID=UPI0014727BDF|nr:type II secretion system protein [Tautonia rosea]